MLVVSMLFEDVVLRKDVGQGIGGLTGRVLGDVGGAIAGGLLGGPIGAFAGYGLGRAIGGQAGRFIGGKVISDPEKAADFSNATDRVGYLANTYTKPLPAVVDAVSGPVDLAGIGSGLYNAVSDNGAKRLGYQMPGRVGMGIAGVVPVIRDLAPLAGLASPDKIAKNK